MTDSPQTLDDLLVQRIVLTNMTQGEQMQGVYERWPRLNSNSEPEQ